MILIAELISHFVNGNVNMATVKKYNVPRDNAMADALDRQDGYGKYAPKKNDAISNMPMKSGGMLKRADGSYSKRGLWDNIRANKGSGKKPTAAMLKQEKKIKAKSKK